MGKMMEIVILRIRQIDFDQITEMFEKKNNFDRLSSR